MANYPTLIDIAKLNLDDDGIGLIEASHHYAPEVMVAASRVIPGLEARLRLRTGLPTTGFRNANAGIAASKSTFDTKLVPLYIASGRVVVDRTLADGYVDGAEGLLSIEGIGTLESMYRTIGRQFYYGTAQDAKGFPGLVAQYDAAKMAVDANGDTEGTGSSVWLVHFSETTCQLLYGANTPLRVSDPRVETVLDAENKAYPAYVQDINFWVGLQLADPASVVRIHSLTNGPETAGLKDDLLYEALAKFPSGREPNAIFMTRRSQYQLRTSRATDLVPQPDLPQDWNGIKIHITDSIRNDEALGATAA